MCGIAGIISTDPNSVSYPRLKAMTDMISHRGPDGEGHWISINKKVGLGHRRLSIIDLSNHASQPMHYADRYSIVFNGEIYNYIELKEKLARQGFHFNTTSDTEVLVALYASYGADCLQQIDGMFSFAIYDNVENRLFVARDRFGEKPFFYHYKQNSLFVFGSEMKSIWAAGIDKKVNNQMLFNYLKGNVLEDVDHPETTFYDGCNRLPHSHYLYLDVSDLTIEVKKYYDLDPHYQNLEISEKEAAERFKSLFYTSVKRRLRSDVPVGSSLSGGLDSSAVVVAIDKILEGSNQKQKTFSAVFPGFAKDESAYMKKVIERTNVEPHFITPTDEGMVEALDKLIFHQEEPFGSASIYVQYCVMKLAKDNGVTVLLDGQGADEILAGYHTYFTNFHKELAGSKHKNAVSEITLYKKLKEETDKMHQVNQGLVGKIEKLSPQLVSLMRKTYHSISSTSADKYFTADFLHDAQNVENRKNGQFKTLNDALYYSTFKKGLHELLRYADRNSMAHSREVRLPFLNTDLVEFVFSLPSGFKIRNAWTKWIMRSALSGDLPDDITWRKDKIGYEPPQKSWMSHPLFMERTRMSTEKLVEQRILKPSVLNEKIKAGGVGQTRNTSWSYFAAGNLFS